MAAEEAVVEPAGEAPARVNVAGWQCSSREELAEKVRQIQDASSAGEDGRLSAQDSFFMFHLLLHHPKVAGIMTRPVSHIRYGTYDKFKNKCFILVLKDGVQEGISASKSIEGLLPKKGTASAAAAAPAGAAVPPQGAAAAEPLPQERRGEKRPREEAAGSVRFEITRSEDSSGGFIIEAGSGSVSSVVGGGAAARAGMGPEHKGWVVTHVDGKEVDAATRMDALQATRAPGRTFELRLRRPEEPAALRRGEAFEPLPVKRGCVLEVSGFKGKPDYDGLKEQLSAFGFVRSLQLEEPAVLPSGADGGAPCRRVVARCRFDVAGDASRATEGVTEVAGEPVKCRLLSGAEEDQHWADLNAKLERNFQGRGRGGRGRGRGRAGRGKGP